MTSSSGDTRPQPGDVVVVGASLAGLRAVQTARELGYTGRLTLVGSEVHLPYDRPPLSKEFLDPGGAETHLLPGSARLAGELDVTVRTGMTATALDVPGHVLTAVAADGTAEQLPYDALLVATGARPRSMPGVGQLAGVHQLRTLDDATAIRDALDRGARTVVVGAGFIGAEIASAAVRRGTTPVLVEAAETPLVRAVGERAGHALGALHERHGAQLLCGVGVARLLGVDRVEGVQLADGREIPADLVVVGIGANPSIEWLTDSGLRLDNGLVCDSALRAGPDVWAAGDVARWTNPLFDRSMRLEHWTNAGDQAAHAMTNLLDPAAARPYDHVPYFWSDWYGQRIQFAGLPIGDPVVVTGTWDAEAFVALYRDGDRLVGALALNRRGDIMKFRALIGGQSTWQAALDLAARRNAAPARPSGPRGRASAAAPSA
jgi:NADPH-dependent 2,4-dienoyl-CoA reductase/sulfur reductase-like enzyme